VRSAGPYKGCELPRRFKSISSAKGFAVRIDRKETGKSQLKKINY